MIINICIYIKVNVSSVSIRLLFPLFLMRIWVDLGFIDDHKSMLKVVRIATKSYQKMRETMKLLKTIC